MLYVAQDLLLVLESAASYRLLVHTNSSTRLQDLTKGPEPVQNGRIGLCWLLEWLQSMS